jgi:hypothetical protein
MRKIEQRMGIREYKMMAEHGNEKRRIRNGNGGRTGMTNRNGDRTRNGRLLLQP